MRAVFTVKSGSPSEAFEIREIDTPKPEAHQVLIKVEGFGLNFADVLARKGMYPDMPERPCVIGYEVVGRVSSQGANVDGDFVGKRVVAFTRFGGYAEYAVTDFRAAGIISESYSAEKALALATQYCTAYYCFNEANNFYKGDKVLVHAAAGGVGIALCQLAFDAGCEVYGTAGSQSKLDFLTKMGVHHPINYRNKEYLKVVKAKLKGAKLDATFNSLAGRSAKKDMKLLGSGGRMVIFGAASRLGKWGGSFANLLLLLKTGFWSPLVLLMKSQAIIGVNMLRISDNKPEVMARCLQSVIALAEAGKIDPVVRYSFKIDELGKAHLALEKRSTIGKVVVFW